MKNIHLIKKRLNQDFVSFWMVNFVLQQLLVYRIVSPEKEKIMMVQTIKNLVYKSI